MYGEALGPAPSMQQGFGSLQLNTTLPVRPPGNDTVVLFLDQWTALVPGGSENDTLGAPTGHVGPPPPPSARNVTAYAGYRDYCFVAASKTRGENGTDGTDGFGRLRATLVWTDPPASLLSALALVNNLDLGVHARVQWDNGSVSDTWFLGNGDRSKLGADMQSPEVADTLNTVEQVTVLQLAPSTGGSEGLGSLRVRVAWPEQGAISELQRYALAVSAVGLSEVSCAHPEVPSASCPNGCSGHGWCREDAACECSIGYRGMDCSATICPARCSDRGTCDTETGVCACDDGFVGGWCQHERRLLALDANVSSEIRGSHHVYFSVELGEAGGVELTASLENGTCIMVAPLNASRAAGQPPAFSQWSCNPVLHQTTINLQDGGAGAVLWVRGGGLLR